jgi:mannose-6-phosphate isomerase-like protein (cupin superfamily)
VKLIEEYNYSGVGYNPYFITEHWQVAKLNPLSGHGVDEINSVEVHQDTDEVFILLKGTAVLIARVVNENKTTFEVQKMESGISYNIPKGLYHNIAMKSDAEIIIVEKSNTHLNDVSHSTLSEEQQKELYELIINAIR